MITDENPSSATSLIAVGILVGRACSPAVARAADTPRGPEFPDELVHFEPASNEVIFAGTGEDTWDQKIRERSYILREGRNVAHVV